MMAKIRIRTKGENPMAVTRQRTTPAPVANIEAPTKIMWSRLDVALLVGVLALALALSFFRLGDPSLWMDEAYSVELARRPLSTLWLAYSVGGEANMVPIIFCCMGG